MANKADNELVFNWLKSTVEGRPGAGDWLYPASGPIATLGKDMTQIATLKLWPFFAELVSAHDAGVPYITRLLCTRDTGQVIKLKGVDTLKYQSHPGAKTLMAYSQSLELKNAEYALLLTSTVLLGGRFPSLTMEDIYATMSTIFSLAHQQQIYPAAIPENMQIKYYPLVHFAIWRMPE